MSKVDLVEIERKAAAAEPALWASLSADAENADRWADVESNANARHIAANSPPVTLALIARIRELEDALRSAVSMAETHDPSGFYPDWLALLEKGTVV